ncbi:hypothetical protein PV350_03960 [Streptomyces sp. PA03-6a]|nr:hypothetical protein [Streptomyces sp. PA03-6a]
MTESGRADPMHLFTFFAPLMLAYASGTLWAKTASLTGVAALAIRLGRQSRAARQRRGTT